MRTGGENSSKPGLRAVLGSAFAAAFGVQSSRNRERDFSRGSPSRYVLAGLAGTILFVLVMYAVVRLVLRSAGM
ncbi:MAG: DUF2970 domain-containing protein [Chromatiales bacterium]